MFVSNTNEIKKSIYAFQSLVFYLQSIKKPLGKQTSRVMAWNKYHHVIVHTNPNTE